MKTRNLFVLVLVVLMGTFVGGCAQTGKGIQKISKPIDAAAQELGKVREVKSRTGSTRAVVAPQQDKKLMIPF